MPKQKNGIKSLVQLSLDAVLDTLFRIYQLNKNELLFFSRQLNSLRKYLHLFSLRVITPNHIFLFSNI